MLGRIFLNSRNDVKTERRSFFVSCRRSYVLNNLYKNKTIVISTNPETVNKFQLMFCSYKNRLLDKQRGFSITNTSIFITTLSIIIGMYHLSINISHCYTSMNKSIWLGLYFLSLGWSLLISCLIWVTQYMMFGQFECGEIQGEHRHK